MTKEEIKAVIELFNELEAKCNEIDKKVWIGFQLGCKVRIKKEYQRSIEDGFEFNIVGISEYINGEKWYMLTMETFENAIPSQYKENQLEIC